MMKKLIAAGICAGLATIGGMLTLVTSSPAQSGGEAKSATTAAKPIPRAADGKPDFTGSWWPGRDLVPAQTSAVYKPGDRIGIGPRSFGSLYKPEVMAKAKTMGDKDDPSLFCIPTIGPTALMGNGFVGEIVQTPRTMVQLIETYHGFRIIPLDGRPHRDDVLPSNRGDAVGHWEGDTLVVEVKNFSETNWIHHHGDISFHSDKLRMIETYRLVDADTLEITVKAEDPDVLTGPWTGPTTRLSRAPFEHIMETSCENIQTAALVEAAAKDNYGRNKK
jgi:hypothetical protein